MGMPALQNAPEAAFPQGEPTDLVLIQTHLPDIKRLAQYILRKFPDAVKKMIEVGDLVSEGFIGFQAGIAKFREDHPGQPVAIEYCLRAATNTMRRYLWKHRYETRTGSLEEAPQIANADRRNPTAEEKFASSELITAVRNIVRQNVTKLADTNINAFRIMHIFDLILSGEAPEQIAKQFDIAPSSISKLRDRIASLIKEELGRELKAAGHELPEETDRFHTHVCLHPATAVQTRILEILEAASGGAVLRKDLVRQLVAEKFMAEGIQHYTAMNVLSSLLSQLKRAGHRLVFAGERSAVSRIYLARA